MALSTPTATTICTEAFNLSGISSPTHSQLSRAESEWFELVLLYIASLKDWDILKETKIAILNAYEQRIAVPVDFENMLEITFCDGTHKGTAQAGTASNITLETTEDISEGDAKGKQIFITGGTGVRGMARIIALDETTKIASICPNWSTNPDDTSTYMIADLERDLKYVRHEAMKIVTSNGSVVNVTYFEGELYFDPIPDLATYAVIMRFVTHISQIDTSSSRYTNILAKWRNALVAGVREYVLKDKNDKRAKSAGVDYAIAIKSLKGQANRKNWQRHKSYAANLGGMPR